MAVCFLFDTETKAKWGTGYREWEGPVYPAKDSYSEPEKENRAHTLRMPAWLRHTRAGWRRRMNIGAIHKLPQRRPRPFRLMLGGANRER